jgi:hypothetical protein
VYICNAHLRVKECGVMVFDVEFPIISDVVNTEISVEERGASEPSIERVCSLRPISFGNSASAY